MSGLGYNARTDMSHETLTCERRPTRSRGCIRKVWMISMCHSGMRVM